MKKRLLQLFYVLSITGILLVFVNGCLWGLKQESYATVKYYDLDTPSRIVLKKIQVRFIPFNSTEPVKYKMVYSDSNAQVLVDDYNKWIQTPSLLLTRYLQSTFQQDGISSESSDLIVSGNVFMFKIDLCKNTVSLGVSYEIKTADSNAIKTVFKNSTVLSGKFEKQDPGCFAEAMSKCAGKLTLVLEKDIKKMQLRLIEQRKALSAKQLKTDKKKK